MPYNVSWLVDKQVILAEFSGDVTIALTKEMDKDLIAYLRDGQAGRLIHVIFDVTQVDKYPVNIAQLNDAAQARHESNVGWYIVINDNQFIKFIGNMITQITQTRFRNFESVEAGIEFLKTQDSRIEWSLMASSKDNGTR